MYWPTVKELFDLGVLTRAGVDEPIHTTELGAALVSMWCTTPLPVKMYVDPRKVAA
jgi:hypothetical protein